MNLPRKVLEFHGFVCHEYLSPGFFENFPEFPQSPQTQKARKKNSAISAGKSKHHCDFFFFFYQKQTNEKSADLKKKRSHDAM